MMRPGRKALSRLRQAGFAPEIVDAVEREMRGRWLWHHVDDGWRPAALGIACGVLVLQIVWSDPAAIRPVAVWLIGGVAAYSVASLAVAVRLTWERRALKRSDRARWAARRLADLASRARPDVGDTSDAYWQRLLAASAARTLDEVAAILQTPEPNLARAWNGALAPTRQNGQVAGLVAGSCLAAIVAGALIFGLT